MWLQWAFKPFQPWCYIVSSYQIWIWHTKPHLVWKRVILIPLQPGKEMHTRQNDFYHPQHLHVRPKSNPILVKWGLILHLRNFNQKQLTLHNRMHSLGIKPMIFVLLASCSAGTFYWSIHAIWNLTEKINTFWKRRVLSGATLSLSLCTEPPKDWYEIIIR